MRRGDPTGSGAQWWVTGLGYDDFKAKDKQHFDQGLRLINLRIRNGAYTAVWQPGSGAQWWAAGLSFDDFKAKDKAYFNRDCALSISKSTTEDSPRSGGPAAALNGG